MEKKTGFLPNMAKKIGSHSAKSTCTWWLNQPAVPQALKKTVDKK